MDCTCAEFVQNVKKSQQKDSALSQWEESHGQNPESSKAEQERVAREERRIRKEAEKAAKVASGEIKKKDKDKKKKKDAKKAKKDKKKKKKKKEKKDKKKAGKGKSSKKKKDKKAKKKKKKDKKKDKDPYSKNAIEKARLEAQQRLMGLNTVAKKSKKKKGKSSSSSSSEEKVERLREFVEGTTAIREQLNKDKEKEKAAPEPEKPVSEMTWPERAAAAACKAENEAIWKGATQEEAREAAEEAGEAVMRRAMQFGYVEPKQRPRFDAAKGGGGGQKPKLSPVEQARSAGLHSVAFASGSGPTFRGGGHFGMTAPKMTGGLEGGGYMG